jgi:hypothetical protein
MYDGVWTVVAALALGVAAAIAADDVSGVWTMLAPAAAVSHATSG